MMEQARISFYSINRCGYYKRGQKGAVFGNVSELLPALKQWVTEKPLGETCTFQVKEEDAHDRTYCLRMVRRTNGATILVLWNETPSSEGNVATVDADAPVGSASVSLTEIPKNSIPGYATYFWILPDRQVIATVSFQHRISGYRPLYKYLRGFLRRFFYPHVALNEPSVGVDQEVIGYRHTAESPVLHLIPSFRLAAVQHPGQITLIKSRRNDIRKIVRKEDLSPLHKEDGTLIRKLLVGFGIANPQTSPIDYRIRYEMGYTPDVDELDEIIQSWQDSLGPNTDDDEWNDVGFIFSGEQSPHWLSYSLERHVIELNVERENEELVNPVSLLKALEGRRKSLLKNIPMPGG